MAEPLTGIRVVEMTTGILGPLCGVYLSDMGADVIKVEPPAGDLSRYARGPDNPLPPEASSPFFAAVNRGKRSVVLDAASPVGRGALMRLVERADVFLSNYREDALARLGLDEVAMRTDHPGLVYAIGTGFGSAGPDGGKAMVDGSAQARGGLAAASGDSADPALVGAVVADTAGALSLALGVVTALLARERHGVGQRVEASALAAQLWLQAWEIAQAAMTGRHPTPHRSHHPALAGVYGLYRTADDRGLFIANIGDPDDWAAFCRFGGMEDAQHDRRWATVFARVGFDPAVPLQQVNEIRPRIAAAVRCHSLADWEAFLVTRSDIVWERVQSYGEVLRDPQVVANGYVAELDVFGAGRQALVGQLLHLAITPGSVKGGPPTLGQHTEEVLASIGILPNEVSAVSAEAAAGIQRQLSALQAVSSTDEVL